MKLSHIHEAKYANPKRREYTGILSLKSGLKLRPNFSIYVSCSGASILMPMRQEKEEFCKVISIDGNGIKLPEIVKPQQNVTVHTYKTGWILRGPNWILKK